MASPAPDNGTECLIQALMPRSLPVLGKSLSRPECLQHSPRVAGPESLALRGIKAQAEEEVYWSGVLGGGGAASLRSGRRALGTIWVVNPWSEVQSLPDAKHPVC